MRKIKQFLCVLCIAALLISVEAPLCFAASVYSPGDANMDGKIDLMDALLVSRSCAGWDVTIDDFNADCNCDDVVNLKDTVLLKRYLAGGWNVVLGEAVLTFDATANGGTFTAGNGFTADGSKKIAPGSTYGTADADGKRWPSSPRKYGCTFQGWYTQPTGGTKVTTSTLFNTKGNITLYAHFSGYMETPDIGI